MIRELNFLTSCHRRRKGHKLHALGSARPKKNRGKTTRTRRDKNKRRGGIAMCHTYNKPG